MTVATQTTTAPAPNEAVIGAAVEAYDAGADERANEPDWLRTRREAALDHFRACGFPTTKLESWKQTPLGDVLSKPFHLSKPGNAALADIAAHEIEDVAARVVVVDGVFDEALSELGSLPAGATLGSLRAHLRADPDAAEAHLGTVAKGDTPESTPVALNLALFRDGVVLQLDEGTRIEAPIQVIFVHTGAVPDASVHDRLLVTAAQGAECTLVETHVGAGEHDTLVVPVTEIVAGDAANIRHIRIQDDSATTRHVGTVAATAGRDATVDTFSFTHGAHLCRMNVATHLQGQGAHTSMDGVFLAAGDQHVDHLTHIDHAVPHTTSRENYKGILAGKAHGVFTGHILVRKDAQQTDSDQSNRNLLLSDQALVDTTPQLEIYADDVKCAHGSTIGQIDDDQVFYLRSRGFSRADARRVLTEAFAGEVISEIPHDGIRNVLTARIAAWFSTHATPGDDGQGA